MNARYLKWTLAVVVLHFLVSTADQQHSGTVVLEKKEEWIRGRQRETSAARETPQLPYFVKKKAGLASNVSLFRKEKSREQKLANCRTSQPEHNLNGTSRTCVRNNASL